MITVFPFQASKYPSSPVTTYHDRLSLISAIIGCLSLRYSWMGHAFSGPMHRAKWLAEVTSMQVPDFIHSFILNIYIAPLQENYSEVHLQRKMIVKLQLKDFDGNMCQAHTRTHTPTHTGRQQAFLINNTKLIRTTADE